MPKSAVIKARVEPELKTSLERIVASRAGDLSDHVREALRLYIAHWETMDTLEELSRRAALLSFPQENGSDD